MKSHRDWELKVLHHVTVNTLENVMFSLCKRARTRREVEETSPFSAVCSAGVLAHKQLSQQLFNQPGVCKLNVYLITLEKMP